jgi:hypothetical protein
MTDGRSGCNGKLEAYWVPVIIRNEKKKFAFFFAEWKEMRNFVPLM